MQNNTVKGSIKNLSSISAISGHRYCSVFDNSVLMEINVFFLCCLLNIYSSLVLPDKAVRFRLKRLLRLSEFSTMGTGFENEKNKI